MCSADFNKRLQAMTKTAILTVAFALPDQLAAANNETG